MDETLKKESSNLDITSEEHVQVGTNLDLLPVDIRVTKRLGAHVDFSSRKASLRILNIIRYLHSY